MGGTLAAVLALGVLGLSGCTSGTPVDGPGTSGPVSSAPTSTGSPAPSPSWSGTETLSPEQLQAFKDATQTVLAYRQTIVDLYSGTRTNLNDLNLVATGELLDDDLVGIQNGLVKGRRIEPSGAKLTLVSAAPDTIDLDTARPAVVVLACVDATAATSVAPDGSSSPGTRELAKYTVVRRGDASDWKVSRVQGDADPEDRAC